MPIPIKKDVGSTIDFLKREKPSMQAKQKTAIALSVARQAGANIPKPKNLISEEIKRRRNKKV